MNLAIADDVARVARISAVPTILEAVLRTTGMRFAAVARVTEQSWTACAVRDDLGFGLDVGGELELETTLCHEVRQRGEEIVFGHASTHPQYCHHPTPRLYGIESYLSMPIVLGDGTFFGTLCAIDPRPASLDDPNLVTTFRLFAQLIASQLDLEARVSSSDTALIGARADAELREQFIAVLGHDLRNPLNSIRLGGAALHGISPRVTRTVEMIERSCTRMGELIDNVLDLARGRLGGGIPLELRAESSLREAIAHVVDEVRIVNPERTITASIDIDRSVTCDRGRLGQLVSNLLVNAVQHGAASEPVELRAAIEDDQLRLVVHNRGEPIPPHRLATIFHPFARAKDDNRPGLGLGLYIASEIAKAHGGSLDVVSCAAEGTRFRFRMPL